MKHVLTIILALLTGIPIVAQITLFNTDYNLVPGDTVYFNLASIERNIIPALGANQIWDFSKMSINDFNTVYFDLEAEANTNIPIANIKHEEEVYQGLSGSYVEYTNEWYELIDELGHSTLGKKTIGRAHSLKEQTGNDRDSIIYLSNVDEYEEPFYKVKFPLEYGDHWTTNFTTNVNYRLLLPSLSLGQINGTIEGEAHHYASVGGWGTLILPNIHGGENYQLDALLSIHRRRSQITWLKQNNSKTFIPLPIVILDFIGVKQVAEVEEIVYKFWVKNVAGPAVQMHSNIKGKNKILVSTSLQTAASNFNLPPSIIDNIYINPNPIKTGQTVYINTKEKLDLTEIKLINMVGKVVLSTPYCPTIRIPPDIIPGMYICQISSKMNGVHSNKRLLIY